MRDVVESVNKNYFIQELFCKLMEELRYQGKSSFCGHRLLDGFHNWLPVFMKIRVE
jgi:hypothetical protein